MDQLPPLHQLSSDQKDALIIALWEENQSLKEYIKILKQENADLKAQIVDLKAEIADLKAQVADLTQKLNSNSQNSHKPPSSDGFKRIKGQREKSEKKRGGQIGHPGQALKACNYPDFIIEHKIDKCSHCGKNIKNIRPVGWKVAQVFEIPQLKIEVTEHRFLKKFCPCCGAVCSFDLPNGINFGTQYGPRLKSFLIYLHHYHYLASERITEFFKDVFGHSLSEGMVFKSEEEAFIHLNQFEEQLKGSLKGQVLLHADETSLRVDGKNQWLHVLSTGELTHYFVHQKRGKQAMDAMKVLPSFNGILLHDHWKAYFQYECSHALCNAHHLRELRAISEGTCHEWATQMMSLLRQIKQAKEESCLKQHLISSFETRYDEIINLGYAQAEQVHQRGPPVRTSHPKEICLLDRLKSRKRQVLMFMYKKEVPFDNNQAERDIRMMKVKMKVSGCFREKLGAQIFCRIRGYISTMKKKGISILQALAQAINGQAISCAIY